MFLDDRGNVVGGDPFCEPSDLEPQPRRSRRGARVAVDNRPIAGQGTGEWFTGVHQCGGAAPLGVSPAMRRIALLCLTVAACAAAVADSASAQVQPAGTGEPAYTNSAQNTQWFEWPATSGADAYRVRYDYYENNTLKASPVVNLANANSGSSWANWSGVATLQHGGQYGVCAQGHYSFPNDPLFFPDGPNSCSMGTMLGRRAYTTIDRSKPTAALQLAGNAAYVKDTKIPLRIDFADDVAGPFPANFLCFEVGVGPNNLCDTSAGKIYGYNAACSVPGGAGKSTTFTCTADYGAIADGNVWACVIAADASIPDNPNGPNQSAHGRQGQPVRPEAATAWCSTARRRRSRSAWPRPRSRSATWCRCRRRPPTPRRASPAPASGRGATTPAAAAATPSRTPTRSPGPTRSR